MSICNGVSQMLIRWIYRMIQVSNTGFVSGFHTTNVIILGGLSGILGPWVGGSSQHEEAWYLIFVLTATTVQLLSKGTRQTLREGNQKCQQMIILGYPGYNFSGDVNPPPKKKASPVKGRLTPYLEAFSRWGELLQCIQIISKYGS